MIAWNSAIMSLPSDLAINVSKLQPAAVTAAAKQMNDNMIAITEKGPAWYEVCCRGKSLCDLSVHLSKFKVGAPAYRGMRERGETALPKPVYLPQAKSFSIPSREAGRELPCRVLNPENDRQTKGVFLHIHGGGWVLMSEKEFDSRISSLQIWS